MLISNISYILKMCFSFLQEWNRTKLFLSTFLSKHPINNQFNYHKLTNHRSHWLSTHISQIIKRTEIGCKRQTELGSANHPHCSVQQKHKAKIAPYPGSFWHPADASKFLQFLHIRSRRTKLKLPARTSVLLPTLSQSFASDATRAAKGRRLLVSRKVTGKAFLFFHPL